MIKRTIEQLVVQQISREYADDDVIYLLNRMSNEELLHRISDATEEYATNLVEQIDHSMRKANG